MPSLLTIPYELRLQIYSHVLFTHPISQHPHLCPSPCSSSHDTHNSTAILSPAPGLSIPFSSPSAPASAHLHHGLFKIPTNLLLTNHQTYFEARSLPFQSSSFIFINRYWCGIPSGRTFLRGLRDWQLDSIRWVGLEILARDFLVCDSTREGEWILVKKMERWRELCGLLGGLKGLRLGIMGNLCLPLSVLPAAVTDDHESGMKGGEEEQKGVLRVDMEWVTAMVQGLKSICCLELEIEDERVGAMTKREFCARLQERLNEEREGGRKDVVVKFVESVTSTGKIVEAV